MSIDTNIYEVYKGVFMRQLPLTGNPLKSINIFIVKDGESGLIFDTGFDNPEVREHMLDYVDKMGIRLEKSILFLTHLHSDHVGLASFLQKKGIGKIYLSRVDGEIVRTGTRRDGIQWRLMEENARWQGLGVENITLDNHPGFLNRPKETFEYIPVDPGFTLDFGDFHFEAIDEAGHTPGMLGMYDREKSILFCGDHVLGKITPNITYWADRYGDSLGIYMSNIKKLKELNIKYLFSSHRHLVEDVNARIDELLGHHAERLEETRSTLEKLGESSVRDVTMNLTWNIKTDGKGWDHFPIMQKWFAVGEAASHLKHLVELGEVEERCGSDGINLYKIKSKI